MPYGTKKKKNGVDIFCKKKTKNTEIFIILSEITHFFIFDSLVFDFDLIGLAI